VDDHPRVDGRAGQLGPAAESWATADATGETDVAAGKEGGEALGKNVALDAEAARNVASGDNCSASWKWPKAGGGGGGGSHHVHGPGGSDDITSDGARICIFFFIFSAQLCDQTTATASDDGMGTRGSGARARLRQLPVFFLLRSHSSRHHHHHHHHHHT
jgi:hypothetical protein